MAVEQGHQTAQVGDAFLFVWLYLPTSSDSWRGSSLQQALNAVFDFDLYKSMCSLLKSLEKNCPSALGDNGKLTSSRPLSIFPSANLGAVTMLTERSGEPVAEQHHEGRTSLELGKTWVKVLGP